ncbi:hypothetical protein MNBD_ALPHA08-1047 [hydrothermal vent metagenome]|uniref:DUF2975 domain-containing protein n=1 Tax=hydrothermal vent metagenome TaxID=652676 RepID=A0A3B0R2N2_9ZZZZ
MPQASQAVPDRIKTIAFFAQMAALAGLLIVAIYFSWLIYQAMVNGELADRFLLDQMEQEFAVSSFTIGQRMVIIALFFLHELFGIVALYAAFRLFSGYRRGEIFTLQAARQLRLVGWFLVLLAPVSTLMETAIIAYLTAIANPASVKFDVSLSDGDVYAIVFGLLIVVVGHIMYEAVQLSDENRAFV